MAIGKLRKRRLAFSIDLLGESVVSDPKPTGGSISARNIFRWSPRIPKRLTELPGGCAAGS